MRTLKTRISLQSQSLTDSKSFILKDAYSDTFLTFSDPKKISLFLTTLRRNYWRECATNQSLHMHSIYSFINNPLSNSHIIKFSKPVSDRFIKFSIRSRTNILGTPEFDEIIHNSNHAPCPLCAHTGANATQSLAHILNGCVKRYTLYTKRHNRVQKTLMEYIRNLRDVEEIYCDKSIPLADMPDNLKLLRPDITVWSNNRKKCLIVEISVPYATINWEIDSLQATYDNKKKKYSELVQHLRNKGIIVEFYVVIVSSLGAVLEESRKDINSLIKCKYKAKTLIKRISANAIIGSMEIWSDFLKTSSKVQPHSSDNVEDYFSDDQDLSDSFDDFD